MRYHRFAGDSGTEGGKGGIGSILPPESIGSRLGANPRDVAAEKSMERFSTRGTCRRGFAAHFSGTRISWKTNCFKTRNPEAASQMLRPRRAEKVESAD